MNPNDTIFRNRAAWQKLAASGNRFAQTAREEDFRNPLASVDGPGWLGGDIRGWKVLCLAAGGGRQGPIYAAAGAQVTVVDFSGAMLELDRQVAQERGLELRLVETSMDNLSRFQTAEFDLVIHPVSTCYVYEVAQVYREVARVTRPGGLYISQHKQPASLQASLQPGITGHYELLWTCYSTEPLPPTPVPNLIREPGTYEYAHRLETLVGSLCRAGFVIEDLTEPCHAEMEAQSGTFADRSRFLPPYIRIKARRVGEVSEYRSLLTISTT